MNSQLVSLLSLYSHNNLLLPHSNVLEQVVRFFKIAAEQIVRSLSFYSYDTDNALKLMFEKFY